MVVDIDRVRHNIPPNAGEPLERLAKSSELCAGYRGRTAETGFSVPRKTEKSRSYAALFTGVSEAELEGRDFALMSEVGDQGRTYGDDCAHDVANPEILEWEKRRVGALSHVAYKRLVWSVPSRLSSANSGECLGRQRMP